MRTVGLLMALANDCDNTDGWEEAAPTVREAAALIERYEEALKPFAAMSFKGSMWEGEFEPPESIVHCNVADGTTVTLGDFKRARAALKAHPEGVGG